MALRDCGAKCETLFLLTYLVVHPKTDTWPDYTQHFSKDQRPGESDQTWLLVNSKVDSEQTRGRMTQVILAAL